MKQQETIAGRIVKNVNKVLEVIPRTLNSEADVIRLNFKKPRKAKQAASKRKGSSKARKISKSVSGNKKKSTKAMKTMRTRKSKTASRSGAHAA